MVDQDYIAPYPLWMDDARQIEKSINPNCPTITENSLGEVRQSVYALYGHEASINMILDAIENLIRSDRGKLDFAIVYTLIKFGEIGNIRASKMLWKCRLFKIFLPSLIGLGMFLGIALSIFVAIPIFLH